jgi:phosphatidylglycerophosphatase A
VEHAILDQQKKVSSGAMPEQCRPPCYTKRLSIQRQVNSRRHCAFQCIAENAGTCTNKSDHKVFGSITRIGREARMKYAIAVPLLLVVETLFAFALLVYGSYTGIRKLARIARAGHVHD